MSVKVTFDADVLARASLVAAAEYRAALSRTHIFMPPGPEPAPDPGYPEGVDILRQFMRGTVDLTEQQVMDISRRMNDEQRRAVRGGR